MKIAVVLVVMSGLGSVSGAHWTRSFGATGNKSAEGRSSRTLPVDPDALPAEDRQFKFLLFLYVDGSSCGGGLVKRDWVLSAAHCLPANVPPTKVIAIGGKANLGNYVKNFYMMAFETQRVGKKFGLRASIAKSWVIHPKYSRKTYEHNVALIELMEPLTGPAVDIIPLSLERMVDPLECTIFGWGIQEYSKNPYQLRYWHGKLAGIPPVYCISKTQKYVICITTDEARLCLGDPGGPLVCEGKVWGVSSRSSLPCRVAPEDYYSELYPELEWIYSVLNSAGRRVASLRGLLASMTGAWLVSAALEVFDFLIFRNN